MAGVEVDLEPAREAVAAAAHRVAVLVAAGVDTSRPVPGLAWTVGDTIAHVATEMRFFALLASGEITPEQMWDTYAPGSADRPPTERIAALNAATMAEFDRGDLLRGGELIEAAVGDFLATTKGWTPETRVRALEGDLELSTLTCVMLGELLIHGRDLAGGLGKSAAIPAEAARLVLAGAASLLPDYLDVAEAGAMRATIDVRVRGGPRFAIEVHDGRLEITDHPPGRVDCHVSAEPVTFLLVAYGRQSHWRGVRKGHLVAWGRRPWLAMRLPRILRTP